MTQQDQQDQLAYLLAEAEPLGYTDLNDLALEEPELFDNIAAEYRREHPQDYIH